MTLVKDFRLLLHALALAKKDRPDESVVGAAAVSRSAPLTRAKLAAFETALGDRDARFLNEFGIAHPLYVLGLLIPAHKNLLLKTDINLLRMLHADQAVKWRAPIFPGDRPVTRIAVTDMRETKAGPYLSVPFTVSVDGETRITGWSGLLIRPARKGDAPQKKAIEPPAAEPVARIRTRRGQPRRYAAASSDNNPIHLKPYWARSAGLPGTIMHGACVMGMTLSPLMRHFHIERPDDLREISLRFSGITRPGWTLDLFATPAGHANGGCSLAGFSVLSPSGAPVLSKGVLKFQG